MIHKIDKIIGIFGVGYAVKKIIFIFAAGLLLKESVLKNPYCRDARRDFFLLKKGFKEFKEFKEIEYLCSSFCGHMNMCCPAWWFLRGIFIPLRQHNFLC